jgi:hypothetical protein
MKGNSFLIYGNGRSVFVTKCGPTNREISQRTLSQSLDNETFTVNKGCKFNIGEHMHQFSAEVRRFGMSQY